MLAGFTSQSPLDFRELTRELTRMADSLVVHQKAHPFVVAPHIAGVAFAPDWRATPPVCQTQTGHIAWLDGEFFNRSALARSATSDPEFLVQAITDERELLNRIDGLFAGVVFDTHKNELHIVTDRYGLRPLYWTRLGNRIAWASQTKAFLALPEFSPAIDPISRDIFFATGQLPSDRTWLKGVAPVPAATKMTFRISDGSLTQRRYWSWDEIVPLDRHHSQRELAHELGARFRTAVEQRTTSQTGLALSGGLDSRAILAAMSRVPKTFTFGHPDSADVRIAAQAASVKNAPHTVFPIHNQNWLLPRISGVWYADGALDLLHMHGIEHLKQQKEACDICLNGAGGDGLAGAGHLFPPNKLSDYLKNKLHVRANSDVIQHLETAFNNAGSAHAFYIDWRMRGFTLHGPRLGLLHGLEYRLPFLDNQVQEFLYSIPLQQKANNRLYRQMLLQTFPEYFKNIPYQATGFPISYSPWTIKILRGLARLRNRPSHTFADYANWLRQSPGKNLGDHLLYNTSETSKLWQRHLAGEDHTVILGRYLTYQLYLLQLFDSKYRTSEEVAELLKITP